MKMQFLSWNEFSGRTYSENIETVATQSIVNNKGHFIYTKTELFKKFCQKLSSKICTFLRVTFVKVQEWIVKNNQQNKRFQDHRLRDRGPPETKKFSWNIWECRKISDTYQCISFVPYSIFQINKSDRTKFAQICKKFWSPHILVC